MHGALCFDEKGRLKCPALKSFEGRLKEADAPRDGAIRVSVTCVEWLSCARSVRKLGRLESDEGSATSENHSLATRRALGKECNGGIEVPAAIVLAI